MIVTDKLSTESFHAFIDEQLTDEQYAQVEAQLDEIPEKIEEIQQCHIINERLREVFDPIVEEPIPDDLFELGLYGLETELSEDAEAFEEEPVSYLELEEDIAAIDSLDIFNEPKDSSYIDDSEADDLELLTQTEHLSEFDIDNLRHDPANIIPDIFDGAIDDEENLADALVDDYDHDAVATHADPADELLESIDTLSLELEKAHESRSVQSESNEPIEEPELSIDDLSTNLSKEMNAGELDLQPADEEYETDELELLDESHVEIEEAEDETQLSADQSSKERVMDILSSEQELTLEPLEEKSNDAFIQELEVSGEEETRHFNKQQNKPVRPRNIRADQVVTDNNEVKPPKVNELTSETTNSAQFSSNVRNASSDYRKNSDSNAGFRQSVSTEEEHLPEDLVAEFFAENKGADFEVNEVVKQFGEVSDNFDDDSHLFDEGPMANIKFRVQEFVNEASARFSDFKSSLLHKKTELMGKFGGGRQDSEYNEAFFAKLSSAKNSFSRDTVDDALDLSGFDDFNDSKPAARHADKGFQDFTRTSESEAGNDFQQDVNLDDFSAGNIAQSKAETGKYDFNSDLEISEFSPEQSKPNRADTPEVTPASSRDFNMNFGFDDRPDENNLVARIGDTLKYYRQKLAEMRAAAVAEPEIENDQSHSGFEKYKNILRTYVGRTQITENPKSLIGAVLFVGLLLGGIVVYLGAGSDGAVGDSQIEKLAIDTHLLNSQFNAKTVVDAESAIIEKLQWFSARIGKQVRLADIRVEDFIFKNVTVIPAMASFAATNIFENKAGQRITLLAIGDMSGVTESPVTCRIPADVDGLCSWVKGSVRYVAVANLSLSRVRSFSEQIIENL